MTRRHRAVVLGSVAALSLAAATVVLMRGRQHEAIRVQTAAATWGDVTRRVLATGTLKPERVVEVGSRVSGTVASIDVDFNTPVRAGQVLARLDPSVYEGRLQEAQARVAQAVGERKRLQAVLDDARATLARAEERGTADPIMSRAELDAARTAERQAAADVKGADAGVAAAEAAVGEARATLEQTTIRSPIHGVVVSRHVEVGQTVSASVQAPVLFTIADLRRMRLLADVAEADVSGLRPGSTVTLQVESIGERTFEGTVAAVRLEPVVEQPAASNSGPANPAASPTGTSGGGSSAASLSSRSTASSSAAPPAASGGQGGTPASPQPGGTAAGPGGQAAATSPGTSPTAQGTTASAGGSGARQPGGTSAARVGVVTYTAVIDVDNVDSAVPPGSTALVMLDGPRRQDVVRIPNSALAFHPSAAAFAAVRQTPPVLQTTATGGDGGAREPARERYVWKFENGQFVPVRVETGLADDSWTELVSGPVQAGDALVTSAVPAPD